MHESQNHSIAVRTIGIFLVHLQAYTKVVKTMDMLKKVARFIETHQLLQPCERVLVGVSGGVDSVVLLHILTSLGFECVVAHCNFHLRGIESMRDEQFVRRLASEYELSYQQTDFDTAQYARINKISIEMAARKLRYDWFAQIAVETACSVIAVAHHADDSAETMLLNLIRGTGLRGLTGIAPINGNVVRPLLCAERYEIERYADTHKLPFVIDSTNASNDYSRNKIRNAILPLMAEINPAVKRTLAKNTERLSGAWRIYSQKIEEIALDITHTDNEHYFIDIKKLKHQTDPQTVLYELLQPFGFNADVTTDIYGNLSRISGSRFYSDSHFVLKDRKFLIVSKIVCVAREEYSIEEQNIAVKEPICLTFRKIERTVSFTPSKKIDKVHIDAEKLKYPLILRHWQAGDVFQPFGMSRNKKISDFFIDKKLNRCQKDAVWVLTSSAGEIIWLVGLRLDNRFRITDKTKHVLEIALSQ